MRVETTGAVSVARVEPSVERSLWHRHLTARRRLPRSTARSRAPATSKPVGFLGCLLLTTIVCATTALAQSLPTNFDPTRNPERDLATALVQAKAEGKRVLVDVGGEWCSWCHRMDSFFDQNGDARTLRDANYVWLKINFSLDNKNAKLLARWPKIEGYPHLFVLDASGKLLYSEDTSRLESGKGYSRERFMAFLERWKPPSRA
jgi:thiol:disulfide interchange protein